MLEKAELPVFIRRFLRDIYSESVTDVEFAGKIKRQFLMARGVRQGCPASGFLFVKAFDNIFRWLQNSVILRVPCLPDCLQPAPCAYADDFAVAAMSFRTLMPTTSPAFKTVDHITGMNLNHRKCCWVQYGNDTCNQLLVWVAANCEEFREMKIAKFAKHVGTMIGPDGYLHRWTAPRKKFIQRCKKSMRLPKVWSNVWWISKSMPCRCLGTLDPYLHQTQPRSGKKLTPHSVLQLVPTMPYPQLFCGQGLYVAEG